MLIDLSNIKFGKYDGVSLNCFDVQFPIKYGLKIRVSGFHKHPQTSYWNSLFFFFNYWLWPIKIKIGSFLTLSVAPYSHPPSFSLHPNFSFHSTSAVSCTDRFMVANKRLELGYLIFKKKKKSIYQIFKNNSLERRECIPHFLRAQNIHYLIFYFLYLLYLSFSVSTNSAKYTHVFTALCLNPWPNATIQQEHSKNATLNKPNCTLVPLQ